MTYALDTNMIIHLLRGTISVRDKRDEIVAQGDKIVIPQYVNYEMVRGFLCNPAPAKEKIYQSLCSAYSFGEINEDVFKRGAEIYADLWKKRFTVDDADILIAAFCMVNNYTLVTDNIKHFGVIDGLTFENWV